MTWIPLLLADPSPCLRWLVLHDLLNLPEDHPELQELAALRPADPLVQELLALQEADGSFRPSTQVFGRSASRLLSTALALERLGYLGLDGRFEPIGRAAEYLFAHQQRDGSWPLTIYGEIELEEEESKPAPARQQDFMIPLQTAFPLGGLAACGYARDGRAERAYEWLLAQRLPDGAWPTGIASGVYRYVAGYRRLPHSRWGCRSNTTGSLLCLARHPERCHSPAARGALDHLLGRETREAYALGFQVARLLGAEPAHGFITFFARFDLALVLDLCRRVGVSTSDERLADLLQFVRSLQGRYGLWEYPARPQVARWVTFDLLRSLGSLGEREDWISLQPRTPFQPYPRRPRRF